MGNIFFADNEHDIPFLEFTFSAWDGKVLAPPNHNNPYGIRDIHILELCSSLQHLFGDHHFAGIGFDIFGQFDVKMGDAIAFLCGFGKVKRPCRRTDGCSLDDKGNDGTQENDVEEQGSMRNATCHTEYGEDDRHGTFQPHPTDKEFIAVLIVLERPETEKD